MSLIHEHFGFAIATLFALASSVAGSASQLSSGQGAALLDSTGVAPLTLTTDIPSVAVQFPGALELQFKGAEGSLFAVQMSPNPRHSSTLVTNAIPAGGSLKVNDRTAPKTGGRFYGAAQQ